MTGYDVIILGTGAGGGMAIKALCEAGLSVCALNAGREIDPKKDFRNHKMPIDLKFRGLGSPSPIFTSRSLRFRRHSRRLSLRASPFERNSARAKKPRDLLSCPSQIHGCGLLHKSRHPRFRF
jgi:choline dehydrogenase-like flavoprotein